MNNMVGEKFIVRSTSNNTALSNSVVLGYRGDFRLVFKPLIIGSNPNDPQSTIKGEFWYQRKGRNSNWEDYKTLDQSQLKKGEWTKLELHSSELRLLFERLSKLYKLASQYGSQDGDYLVYPDDDPITELLNWVLQSEMPNDLIKVLSEADPEKVKRFNSLIDISNLKKLHDLWLENKNNSDEEFWQKTFKENPWLISQLFSSPVVVIKDKAYVGGKTFENQDGQITDFLVMNPISTCVAIVEIKTPTKVLVRKDVYRDNIYAISSEVTGGTIQIANQRDSLLKSWNQLNTARIQAINPKCLFIVGNIQDSGLNSEQKKSFYTYRGLQNDIEIITFDELFKKVEMLISLLQRN